MPKPKRGLIVVGSLGLSLSAVAALFWLGLNYRPGFYRELTAPPPDPARRHADAERFVANGLRLRNDIVNEPHWQAEFSDDQVNAWLAEDLVVHFAELIPPGVEDPRLIFETDRAILAFRWTDAPVPAVVSVVVRLGVPRDNEVRLVIEKIRAGVLPVPTGRILDQITEFARARGVQVDWESDGDQRIASIRYQADARRRDVVLEALEIAEGKVRVSGRSDRSRGPVALPSLPTRRVLQSKFPRRNVQARGNDLSAAPGGVSASGASIVARPRIEAPASTTSTRVGDQSRIS